MLKNIKTLLRNNSFIIAFVTTIIIVCLSLIRVPNAPIKLTFTNIDKIFHGFAYFMLALSWLIAYYKKPNKKYWIVAQWVTTGFLWYTWLSHDMANIAVFLPREIPLEMMFSISAVFVFGLYWMFREGGGKIQDVVISKHSTKYVRSATLIDLFYFIVLWFFKELNDIPMSTTWVFIGLLSGRELAIASFTNKHKFKTVFPLIGRDFFKMMIGLAASVAIVVLIHSLV